MKRSLLLVLLIGLAASSVSIAKGHEPVYVSVSDQGIHFDAITNSNMSAYVPVETGEVIKRYAEAIVMEELDVKSDEVFHPPATNRNIVATNRNYKAPGLPSVKFRRDYANGVRCNNQRV